MLRRLLIPAVLLLLIAACSAPAESSSDGGGGGGGASPGSEPSSAATADSGSGGGGGGAASACDLITTDEVATVMGVASTEATPTAGDPSYCNYTADGSPVAATSYGTQDAETIYGAYQNDGPSVSGIGDKAVFSNSTGTLFFVKGSSIVGITAGPGSMDASERQALAEQLGLIAAGNL